MRTNKVLGGLFGLCVGDALGVPVEGSSRKWLKEHPVTEMIGFRAHNQPPGTWSDDSSLAFCLAESLCQGFDLQDMADKFCAWLYQSYWTPYGETFGIGGTTFSAISRLKKGVSPVEAGGKDEYCNGNGSLMRILPLAYYLNYNQTGKQFEIIHQVSSITHGHIRSQMACGVYIQLAMKLLKGGSLKSAYEGMKPPVLDQYGEKPYESELGHFARILQTDIAKYDETEINSSGYVIDTLEASLWCLLNYTSYEDTVLQAVNLGGDTDTTAAVVGGLAGIYYGFEDIPKHWIDKIARKEDIVELADKLNKAISGD